MTFANSEQADFWETMAPTWAELEEFLSEVSGEPGRQAMDRLDLDGKTSVLDLGCGTGQTTLELAKRVSPRGRAVGVDIADAMLDTARQHAADAGIDNVEFVHADVQIHPFEQHEFDAAFSRFGVMFYADPVAAFAGVHRALAPGGSLSFVCWQPIMANEWMLVPGMAAVSVTGQMPPMPEPDQPGPFSLADPDRVSSILGDAGFKEVDIQPRNDFVVRPADRIPQLAAIALRVGAVRVLLKDADQSMSDRVRDAIEEALQTKVEGGDVRVGRGVLLVAAQA